MSKAKAEKKKLSKKAVIIIIIAAILLIGAAIGVMVMMKKSGGNAPEVKVVESEATVERRDILNTISGSSVIQPKDSYEITSLVNGDIIYAGFEKGDVVNKDDVLFRIDSSDIEKNVTSASNSLTKANKNYNDAVEAVNDLTVKALYSGKVAEVAVKEDDNISDGGVIAKIYDDTRLELTVPFVEGDAALIAPGQAASVSVVNNGSVIQGSVKEVGAGSYAGASRTILRDVTVVVDNPGALTPQDKAIVEINGLYCSDTGNFEYITEKNLLSTASGKIKSLNIKKGDVVSAGQTIALIENESVTDAVENARLSLSDSQLSYENARDRVEDYTIKAPISGTVVEKNVKAGDKFDSSSTSGQSMAIIYDMSSLVFELSIDETDIARIHTGQSVSITADAIQGRVYSGRVTNVSIVGQTNYGITTYPVKVEITEFDDALVPGMNIEASISVSNATNVLAVPISAINRGNTVYVKGEKEKEDDTAPEGFKTVAVVTGETDGMYIEVKEGLEEGQTVKVIDIVATNGGEEQKNMMMQMPGMGGGMPGMGMGGGMPQGMRSGGSMGGSMRSGGSGMRSGGMR